MSNDKKTIEKLTSRVKIYLVIIALLFILICTYDIKWVIPSIVLYILIILYTMWSNTKKKTEIETHIEEVAWGMNSTVRNTLNKSSIPLLVIETDGDVIFRNPKFNKEFKDVDVITYVDSLIKEIKLEIENNNDKKEITKQISIENKVYKVMCEYTISKKRDKRKQKEYVLTLNFIDETKYNELFDKYINEKLCIGIAVIDNYEEIIQKLSPEEKTAVLAKIEKTMFDWASTSGGVVIKNERDTYIYIFEQKYLAEIEKNKINILDLVKEIDTKVPITLSISISNEENSYYERYKSALDGIDLVLGRGGDQCIVRKEGKYKFYGGKSLEVEKRTRVKARIVAHTIESMIEDSKKVIIMGHQNADIDSLGSSMGMYRLAITMEKPAYIVATDLGMNLGKFVDTLKETEYEEAIIDKKEALNIIDKDTLLIVVDTHKKTFVQVPELLTKTDKIVVIDHHRKGPDFIDNASLTFQEVYASSAAELVTEILQYVERKVELTPIEIESLYGGIMVDTKNFTFKTGVRTFEVAAYLKKYGLDLTEVKQIFKNDFATYVAKVDIVKKAEILKGTIAISTTEENYDDMPVIAAQAADELLNITGILASFVLCKVEDVVMISGRSMGDINVQAILEKVGGGGHLTFAGAQLAGITIDEAKEKLIQSINEYFGNE